MYFLVCNQITVYDQFILCLSCVSVLIGALLGKWKIENFFKQWGLQKNNKSCAPYKKGFFSVFFFFFKFILKSSKTLKQILNLIHINVHCVSLEINPNSNLDLLVPYDILHVKIVSLICQKMKGANLFKNVSRI